MVGTKGRAVSGVEHVMVTSGRVPNAVHVAERYHVPPLEDSVVEQQAAVVVYTGASPRFPTA